jgi:hypothetical protein
MPSISLLITAKWRSRPPILSIPGYGTIKRPSIGRLVVVQSELAANWLITNQYAVIDNTLRPSGSPGGIPPIPDNEADPPIKRQVILGENSQLELDPPLVVSIPGEGEQVLINFFNSSEPAEINTAIRAITLKMAQELKSANPLDWTEVVRILSERALDAAAKWVQQQA